MMGSSTKTSWKKACLLNGILPAYLRIHWRLSTILKTSKKMHEVMFFWYVKVGMLWKCIKYIETKHICSKNFLWTKSTVQKMPSFFSHDLQVITVLLLIFDFYMSWKTSFFFLKLYVKFSIFDCVSFLSKFLFFSVKCMESLILKRQNNRKAIHSFTPRPLIFRFL